MLVSDAARQGLAPALARVPSACRSTSAAPRTCAASPASIFTAAAWRSPSGRRPWLAAALVSPATLVVALDGVGNADNVGGVFRNAAAFGVDAVLLGPTCCDPLYRKAVRTSMAATLRVPFARVDDWSAALALLRAAGFAIVALTPREPSEELAAFAARPRPERLALLVGAEGAGLTRQSEAAADYRVRIAIRADVDSLNLAVAAGIALERLALLPLRRA